MKLKRYQKNLWVALTGRNPYKVELDEISIRCDQAETTARVQERKLSKMNDDRISAEQQVRNYQKLTENLRERISEKDAQLEQKRQDYVNAFVAMRHQNVQQREKLEQKNQELRDELDVTLEQLQRVSKDVGREMTNTNLLAKTNNALSDLYQAMASEDVEKMKAVMEYLEWSNPLSRIAQYHLNVLVRKKELEERMSALP